MIPTLGSVCFVESVPKGAELVQTFSCVYVYSSSHTVCVVEFHCLGMFPHLRLLPRIGAFIDSSSNLESETVSPGVPPGICA